MLSEEYPFATVFPEWGQNWRWRDERRESTRDRARSADAGPAERDIWDIASVAAFFNMTNRVATATAMAPNPGYHGQARRRASRKGGYRLSVRKRGRTTTWDDFAIRGKAEIT
jgi:hypothetical protein